MKVRVGAKTYNIDRLESDTARRQGLRNTSKLPKGYDGVALVYAEPSLVTIDMSEMKYNLTLIFIVEDVVIGKTKVSPTDIEVEYHKPVDCVLELHEDELSNIHIGDSVMWVGEKTDSGKIVTVDDEVHSMKENEMAILDENGHVQGKLQGNERIFSRKDTMRFYELALIAEKTRSSTDFKKLGRAVVRAINKQDNRTKINDHA
jgi:uncharacterized membrane protein (UPF0127 family)